MAKGIGLIVVALAAAALTGCSGDECTRAAEHYTECVPTFATSGGAVGGNPPECSGKYQCESKCVEAASCEALTLQDKDAAAAYASCIDACANVE